MMPGQKAVRAWKQSSQTLEIYIRHIHQYNPREISTFAAIKRELKALERFWLQPKSDFVKLDNNFTEEEEVDNYGLPEKSARQAE